MDFRLEPDGLSVATAGGRRTFAAIYPALGSMVHSDLARSLGADLAEEGCIKVDDHQRTSVPGLYAAGDVVSGLDQISHAMGEAGVAATTVRNDLAQKAPLRR
jgi:thioredoxin reductase (NADPH)